MRSEVLFESGGHKWITLGRDPEKRGEVIDTNEFIIINNGQAVLLDPGGIEIFPQVLTEITRYVSTDNIKAIIASHQDPDIASSLAMWVDLCPNVKTYCPWIWSGFIAHFGMGTKLELTPIPDEGMELQIGNTNAMLYLVPAHYCHSSGNFSCYDPKADILFSGDIGGALLPNDSYPFYVEDFTKHISLMEKFHKRWMPSVVALKEWVRRIRLINPAMICPQHGSIFRGEQVNNLLDWLDNLEVRNVNLGSENTDINRTIWMKWKK
jgi:flavorubredoxin